MELGDLVNVPLFPSIAWRQCATEAAVRRALELQVDGRHLLLCGDPVAAGEVLAAPSAGALDGIAVCLLDVSAEAQAARLAERGDDPSLLPDHRAFAAWMRGHARDPQHMPHVLTTGGWDQMRWDRWVGVDPLDTVWAMEVLNTTALSREQVAAEILAWCRRALAGQVHVAGPRGN